MEKYKIYYHRMLMISVLVIIIFTGWLIPFVSNSIPYYEEYRVLINIVGDFVLVTSLFIIGGDFWDKLRPLFIYGAKAKFKKETRKMERTLR